MPIPKVIYQTWKTKDLHKNCVKVRAGIQKLNPAYEICLYDDDDMAAFIQSNFSAEVYHCYLQLNVGAAKADFWRYCVLYKNGGVYLDIDSVILKPLEDLIQETDQCIITREANKGAFNNWIMIFEKAHPILFQAIKNCCFNIKHRVTFDVCQLTGPWGAFTDAVNSTMVPYYHKKTHLYFEDDSELNRVLNNFSNDVRCRFYGVDMGLFAKFKHKYCSDLYKGHRYWRDERNIFKDIQ